MKFTEYPAEGTIAYSCSVWRKSSRAKDYDTGRYDTEAEAIDHCLGAAVADGARGIKNLSLVRWTSTGDSWQYSPMTGDMYRLTLDEAKQKLRDAGALS